MTRLIHLNGPPGIGKSTIARRYCAEHAGVLNCDIDVLRTWIGGWESDYQQAGILIRPAALALIEAYLREGHDVVLPQMLVNPREVARFEGAAHRAGAEYVELMLLDERQAAIDRFHRRGGDDPGDAWHAQVREIVDAEGGSDRLGRCYDGLVALGDERPGIRRVPSIEGSPEATYAALLRALDGRDWRAGTVPSPNGVA